MSGPEALYVLPALRAEGLDSGRVTLTRKFIDGAAAYAQRWPGPVVVCMEQSSGGDSNLDQVHCNVGELPFAFQWLARGADAIAEQIGGAALVLGSLTDRHTCLAGICRRLGVPLVYVAEHSRATRWQIICAQTSNPILRCRRWLWNASAERDYRRALRLAAGVQCNGAPAYEAYHRLSDKPLLYFDSRVGESMFAGRDVIAQRTGDMLSGGPLRLGFSGRLIRIKGVDHLPRIAAELARLNVPFTMDICGAGVMEDDLRSAIDRLDLRDKVILRGVLDFQNELLPFVAASIDLFVCCHRQSDPSCTYLETMSCGTPIIGYDNQALKGIVEHSSVGWLSPMNHPELMARRIAELNEDRSALAKAAADALRFAARHTFEQTMQKRVDHMLACSIAQRAGIAT